MEMVTKGGGGGEGGGGSKKLSSLLSPRSHSDIFRTVESGSRGEVAALLEEDGVSLGMADPTTGRSLLYRVLTTVTNGDKIVIGRQTADKIGIGRETGDKIVIGLGRLTLAVYKKYGVKCLLVCLSPRLAVKFAVFSNRREFGNMQCAESSVKCEVGSVQRLVYAAV